MLIEATSLHGGPGTSLRAGRVFLAAGVVSSTIILQRSWLLPASAEMRDSQTLYLPFAWIGGPAGPGANRATRSRRRSSCSTTPPSARTPMHMSLYTYNDGLSERARAAHPALSSMLGPLLDGVTRRLVVGICFFHSEDSHAIRSNWRRRQRLGRLEPALNPARRV